MSASGERPLRLLALDDGGMRGLASIYVLRGIMDRVNLDRSEAIQPWEYFDMMCGSGTGGIIAVMLGYLKMSIDECEKAFKKFCQEAFIPRKASRRSRLSSDPTKNTKFETEKLDAAIKTIIEGASVSPDVSLIKEEPECKVLLAATQSTSSLTSPAVLRTYKIRHEPDLTSGHLKLWQACRATMATMGNFAPLHLDRSGHFWAESSPSYHAASLYKEALGMWDSARRMCLVGVETGYKLVLSDVAAGRIPPADTFELDVSNYPELDGNYYRFKIDMGKISFTDHQSLSDIRQAAASYNGLGQIKTKIGRCVEEMRGPEGQGAGASCGDEGSGANVPCRDEEQGADARYGKKRPAVDAPCAEEERGTVAPCADEEQGADAACGKKRRSFERPAVDAEKVEELEKRWKKFTGQ